MVQADCKDLGDERTKQPLVRCSNLDRTHKCFDRCKAIVLGSRSFEEGSI
jgi:hypothetical protein